MIVHREVSESVFSGSISIQLRLKCLLHPPKVTSH